MGHFIFLVRTSIEYSPHLAYILIIESMLNTPQTNIMNNQQEHSIKREQESEIKANNCFIWCLEGQCLLYFKGNIFTFWAMQRFCGLIDVSTLKLGTPYWILKLVISPTIINQISDYFPTKYLKNNEKIQTSIISFISP